MATTASAYEPYPEDIDELDLHHMDLSVGERTTRTSSVPPSGNEPTKPTIDLAEKDLSGLGRHELVARLVDAIGEMKRGVALHNTMVERMNAMGAELGEMRAAYEAALDYRTLLVDESRKLDAEITNELKGSGSPAHDPINSPSHYTSLGAKCSACGHPIECIDVTRHMGFVIGNVVKYCWRIGRKGDALEQAKKARWYLDDQIATIEKDGAR